MNRTATMIAVLAIAATTIGAGRIQQNADRLAIERAVLDYVEGIYEVKPERIDRGVHLQMAKRGFTRGQNGTYRESTMNFAELRALAGRWNAQGRVNPKTAKKEVVVLDMLDQTASVKLVASWGTDYMHLARYDGEWKIVNVLWQVPPSAAN